jgi:hypothetical protein
MEDGNCLAFDVSTAAVERGGSGLGASPTGLAAYQTRRRRYLRLDDVRWWADVAPQRGEKRVAQPAWNP